MSARAIRLDKSTLRKIEHGTAVRFARSNKGPRKNFVKRVPFESDGGVAQIHRKKSNNVVEEDKQCKKFGVSPPENEGK